MRHILLPLALLAAAGTSPGQDAERASHGLGAAAPQISFEEQHGDFIVRQYQLGCLSQLTYLLGSGNEAAIVDPQRDVTHYEEDADALGLDIKWVILTHTNADFVAGHTELARRYDATILISGESGSLFEHDALQDGDRRPLGDVELEFWATPGHTLDSMTTLVHLPGVSPDPAYIITGDTLFIGGIGRPDLVGGEITPSVLAGRAFDTMQRFKTLPDATKILPGHGAGSLCGAHLSPETVSTVGAERATNPYLQIESRTAFISRVITGLPVAPKYFAFNVNLNRTGPPAVDWKDEMPPSLAPDEVAKRAQDGAWLIDLRGAKEYANGHISGAVNIDVRGRIDTWTGIAVPFEADLLLVGDDDLVKEAAFRFRRIGLDHLGGYLAGGMDAWKSAGQPVRRSELIDPAELAARIAAGTEPVLVDVRTPTEYEELRVGDYANLPVSDAAAFGRVLDRTQPVTFLCNSAYRSSMAVGLAERQGFENVSSLDGGLDAWLDAGLPVIGTMSEETDVSTAMAGPTTNSVPGAGSPMILPEPMEPGAVARAMMDQPQLYRIIDIRPSWQFDEYHIAGASNVAPAAVEAFILGLPAGVRAILVDRDGTTAFAVAGLLQGSAAGETHSLRAMIGGTAAYFREVELGESALRGAVGSSPMPTSAPAADSASASPAAPAPAASAKKPQSKRRSAGC
ncbi:rhodanese-like domain-containing protein [Planctomycetes bacterium Poly30]